MHNRQNDFTGPVQPTSRTRDKSSCEGGMSLSMHDGVEVWCDCCSCEAEPYWLEALEKAGACSVQD